MKKNVGVIVVDMLNDFIREDGALPCGVNQHFIDTMAKFLKMTSADALNMPILMGVCTDICVMHTCADARNRDYKTIIAKPLVASFDEKAHKFALDHMENILGAIVSQAPMMETFK